MFINNQDRIVKSLETIAKCMVKSNEMASEALKKSNDLYKANVAMIKEINFEYVDYQGYTILLKLKKINDEGTWLLTH